MDGWAHRSTSMRCRTCMFYVQKEPTEDNLERQLKIAAFRKAAPNMYVEEASEAPAPHTQLGRCRRHAPVVGQGWPAVFETDWCGDHKLDENKA